MLGSPHSGGSRIEEGGFQLLLQQCPRTMCMRINIWDVHAHKHLGVGDTCLRMQKSKL